MIRTFWGEIKERGETEERRGKWERGREVVAGSGRKKTG